MMTTKPQNVLLYLSEREFVSINPKEVGGVIGAIPVSESELETLLARRHNNDMYDYQVRAEVREGKWVVASEHFGRYMMPGWSFFTWAGDLVHIKKL